MKLIMFRDYPEFMPMLNPNEMLELGVANGIFNIFKPLNKDNVNRINDLTFSVYPKYKGVEKNHFELSKDPPLPYADLTEVILEWMRWYFLFYYGKRSEQDSMQIVYWQSIITIMWKNHKKTLFSEEEIHNNIKQFFLNLSWWWQHDPTLILKK